MKLCSTIIHFDICIALFCTTSLEMLFLRYFADFEMHIYAENCRPTWYFTPRKCRLCRFSVDPHKISTKIAGPHDRCVIVYFWEDVQNFSKSWEVTFSANITWMRNFAIIREYYCDNVQINGYPWTTATVYYKIYKS